SPLSVTGIERSPSTRSAGRPKEDGAGGLWPRCAPSPARLSRSTSPRSSAGARVTPRDTQGRGRGGPASRGAAGRRVPNRGSQGGSRQWRPLPTRSRATHRPMTRRARRPDPDPGAGLGTGLSPFSATARTVSRKPLHFDQAVSKGRGFGMGQALHREPGASFGAPVDDRRSGPFGSEDAA